MFMGPTPAEVSHIIQGGLRAYLDQQLDGMVKRPEMYCGGDPFTLEMMYIQAVDFRAQVDWLGAREQKNVVSAMRYWSGVLHDHGYQSTKPLAHQVEGPEAMALLVELLPRLRESVPRSAP